MDTPGWILLVWFLGSLVLLAAIEAYCVLNGLPTISDRVRGLGDTRIVLVLTVFVTGYLTAHFFDRSGKGKEGS